MINIIGNKTASNFLRENENYLLQNESQNNLMLGLVDSIVRSRIPSDRPLFYTIEENGVICGQAIRTDPNRALIISSMGELAISSLVRKLKEEGIALKSAVGPIDTIKVFSSKWRAKSSIGMHQGIYELRKVIHPNYEGGQLILAKDEHFDLINRYCYNFIRDCFPNDNREGEAAEAAKRFIQNKNLFLWCDQNGRFVSMAANNRESKNGATISWVYTPSEYRNQGYGSKVVASLSQHLMDNGKELCNLFTDLLNPTSNSIYQKIGYQMIGETIHFNFDHSIS